MKRKILAITGSRSDYSIMVPIYKAIKESNILKLDLIVTGMHFLPEFSLGVNEIANQKFGSLHLFEPHPHLSMTAMSAYLLKELDYLFENLYPDIVLIQGDRYEMLPLAMTAAYRNIPIIHMSGGDFSGSIDDSLRNAITSFAHIHLTSCSLSTQKLLKRGEQNNRVIEVGEPGLENINNLTQLPKNELFSRYHLDEQKPLILVTQHPVTTEAENSYRNMLETLNAFDKLNLPTILTYPNTDLGYQGILKAINEYRDRPWLRIVPTLGITEFLNLLSYCSVLVGNTSSGIIEAPTFKVPFVNIGTRQINRLRATNVLDVGYHAQEISTAITKALFDEDFKQNLAKCINPYGDGHTSLKVVNILEKLNITPNLLSKWVPSTESFI